MDGNKMKKFLIIGNVNAITFKGIFPLIKENKLWMGVTMNGSNRWFEVPQSYIVKPNAAGYKEENGKKYLFVNGVIWFTNLDHKHHHQPLDLYRKYSNESYPKYDNYDAIECSKVVDIPMDYEGIIGVPITFLDKYCPEQFEIIGITGQFKMTGIPYTSNYCCAEINGIRKYARIFIKKNKCEER